MRSLQNFSAREWVRLLPLKHALKQARNDLWLMAYQRRRPPALAEFLKNVAPLRGQSVALVIAFEQPWALDWLLRMARRNLADTTVLVFDNSINPSARREIERVCREHGAPYLALPLNRTRHVNRSHGMAMSWVYRNVVRPMAPRAFAFIDHDLIPVRPTRVAERLGSQQVFGMLVDSPWAWQLWAGYCMFDHARNLGLPLNFLYDFSQGLDTGGRNWRCLYRHQDRHQLRFATSEVVHVPDADGGPPTAVQVVDGDWLHIGGISYNQNFKDKAKFCETLSNAFERGLSWEQICAPAGAGRQA